MLKNYVLVGIRNLTRNKFFSAINIFGLAAGMCICMAIMMLVADQMTYDRHNSKRDRIYRVNSFHVDERGIPTGGLDNATSPMPLGNELINHYTGIEKSVRIRRGFGNNWLELDNQNVNIPVKGYFVDPDVLDVFELELLYGDIATALSKPYSVVLTYEAARKLFKEENPLGLTFVVGDIGIYTVTGVLKKTENKSHVAFEALASISTIESLQADGKFNHGMDNWFDFWSGWTYIVVKEDKNVSDIQAHLDEIYNNHIVVNTNPNVYKAKFRLQHLLDITPGPLVNNSIGPSLPWVFVYFLAGLSAVIMLTSCFNFTNLSVARSLKRAKEIGVRKVTGAGRWQIFTQFLSESIVIALCALALALLLLVVLKPLILQLNFAKIFLWDLQAGYAVLGVFLVFAVIVGIIAGLFPALVLSGFQPVKVLKNVGTMKLFSRLGLRQGLLVTQFTLSLVFILTVIVMYNQLKLFVTKDYGFNMTNNVMVRLNQTPAATFKAELLKYGNIKNVSAASHIPASGMTMSEGFKRQAEEKDWKSINNFHVDEDYARNMELEMIAGRFFLYENGESNRNFIVINEEAVKALEYKSVHEAIGQEIFCQADSSTRVISGVIENYNHNSLFSKIEPLALMYQPEQLTLLQVRYEGSAEEAYKTIEHAWTKVNPTLKIDYREVEEEVKFFYNFIFGDLVNILGALAALAIMISCLGLLGMATYTIETRMKEISIRKVLGSTDNALVFLLSKGFLKLLIIAIFLGVPIAWFLNNFWLEFIAYHTQLSVGSVLLGIAILFVLAGITVSSQTLRAAFTNPVENLKNE